jgi:hypothetical protein
MNFIKGLMGFYNSECFGVFIAIILVGVLVAIPIALAVYFIEFIGKK